MLARFLILRRAKHGAMAGSGASLAPQAAYQPSTPKISSSITRRGTNPSEGSRGSSRVAPTTDSLAGGAPIAIASPSPERGERSPSQEWQQQLASSWFSPSRWNERQLCGVGLFQGNSAIWLRRRYQGSCRLVPSYLEARAEVPGKEANDSRHS